MTDEELIQACLKNDGRAQKTLFDTFSPKMMGVCLRYAKDKEEADDMLQVGFIKVFQKLSSYSGTGSLGGWIHRTVVNTCLDLIRKNSKFRFNVEIENVDYLVHQEESASSGIRTKELLSLVQQLPEGYRVVFNMFAIEGYGHKEIAKTLGISENTSKSQYRKARLWLQKAIIELDEIKN
tara:strand:+ start:40548 stop:41087 length:540 start_codon:yes stop_codon:yes gene_type:complete